VRAVVITRGAGFARELDRPRLHVGRVSSADICLPFGEISKYHCVLYPHRDVVLIADAYSACGTELGSQKIDRAFVDPTARIIIGGDTVIKIEGCRRLEKLDELVADPELPDPLLFQLAMLAPEAVAARAGVAQTRNDLDITPLDLKTVRRSIPGNRRDETALVISLAARSREPDVRDYAARRAARERP
jgi:hypothetical protein